MSPPRRGLYSYYRREKSGNAFPVTASSCHISRWCRSHVEHRNMKNQTVPSTLTRMQDFGSSSHTDPAQLWGTWSTLSMCLLPPRKTAPLKNQRVHPSQWACPRPEGKCGFLLWYWCRTSSDRSRWRQTNTGSLCRSGWLRVQENQTVWSAGEPSRPSVRRGPAVHNPRSPSWTLASVSPTPAAHTTHTLLAWRINGLKRLFSWSK